MNGNIDRWKGQFGAKPDKDKEETIDVGGIKVTLVDFSGTFDDSRGMMGPTVTPDYRLLGAIFADPERRPHFRQVLRAEEDDRRPGRRDQGHSSARSRWTR